MARKPTEKAVLVPPSAKRDDGTEEPVPPMFENVAPINPHGLPLFPSLGRKGPHPTELRILRTDPSYARAELKTTPDLQLSWEQIQSEFGGGTYRLECLDEFGRIIPGGIVTRKIPGEPKDSEGAGGSLGALTANKLHKGLASVLQAERDFNERLISRQQAEADLRIKVAREETAAKIAELEAKARIDRERELERRRAEREEERDRHSREIDRERQAHEQRLTELRLAAERQEKALEREREREREAASERVAASERMMSVVLGTVQSQTQTMVAAMQNSRSDVGAMLGMFQNGMQLMQQVGQANAPSEATQALTMLGNIGEKTLQAYTTKTQTEALAEVQKRKLAAGQPPPKPLPAPANSNPSSVQRQPNLEKPSNARPGQRQPVETKEQVESKAATIEAKAKRVLDLCIEQGIDPEEVLDDVAAQLSGELTPEDILARDFEEELEEGLDAEKAAGETSADGSGTASVGNEGRSDAGGTEAGALGGSGPGDGKPPARRRDRGRNPNPPPGSAT